VAPAVVDAPKNKPLVQDNTGDCSKNAIGSDIMNRVMDDLMAEQEEGFDQIGDVVGEIMGELEGHEERFDHIDDKVEAIARELKLLRLEQARETEQFQPRSQAPKIPPISLARGGGGRPFAENGGNIDWARSLLQGNARWENLSSTTQRTFADLLLGKATELALELLPTDDAGAEVAGNIKN
jgi:hypothetical protein